MTDITLLPMLIPTRAPSRECICGRLVGDSTPIRPVDRYLEQIDMCGLSPICVFYLLSDKFLNQSPRWRRICASVVREGAD